MALFTCAHCSDTIERRPGSVYGWGHVTETPRNADGHRPEPDDGPDRCDECGELADDDCNDECDCSDCEERRALDADADAWIDRCRD